MYKPGSSSLLLHSMQENIEHQKGKQRNLSQTPVPLPCDMFCLHFFGTFWHIFETHLDTSASASPTICSVSTIFTILTAWWEKLSPSSFETFVQFVPFPWYKWKYQQRSRNDEKQERLDSHDTVKLLITTAGMMTTDINRTVVRMKRRGSWLPRPPVPPPPPEYPSQPW